VNRRQWSNISRLVQKHIPNQVSRIGSTFSSPVCGTGQDLVETARQFEAAQVLAVDLSLPSLCYAKRQALCTRIDQYLVRHRRIRELGERGRRDQAGAGALGRSAFDIVVAKRRAASHMADPWRLRALLSLLRPGAFMRVGLYSKLARRHINAVRASIAARGYSSTAEDIRRCRQDIFGVGARRGCEESRGISRFFQHQRMPRYALSCARVANDAARDRALPRASNVEFSGSSPMSA